MTMIRRATGRPTGEIKDVAEGSNNPTGVVVCKACTHIVFRANLNGSECPYCHNNVNKVLGTPLLSDDDDDSDVIAQSC